MLFTASMLQPAGAADARSTIRRDDRFICYFYFSLACPQDSRAALPRFAWPGRDWIHLVYI